MPFAWDQAGGLDVRGWFDEDVVELACVVRDTGENLKEAHSVERVCGVDSLCVAKLVYQIPKEESEKKVSQPQW